MIHHTPQILIVIANNQFDEGELFPVLEVLKNSGIQQRVVSRSGRESRGIGKTKFQPDGLLIDWDKGNHFSGKYDAVLVLGGRGAMKSIWNDPILPQILTDHFRAGKTIGAIGLGVAALASASLLNGEASGPDNREFLDSLNQAGVTHTREAVTRDDRMITASGPESAEEFAAAIVDTLK